MALSGKYGRLDIPLMGRRSLYLSFGPRISWRRLLSRCTDCWRLHTGAS